MEDDNCPVATIGAAGTWCCTSCARIERRLIATATATFVVLEAIYGGHACAARVAGREVGHTAVLRADGHEGGGCAQTLAGTVGLRQFATHNASNGAHITADKDVTHIDEHQLNAHADVDACDGACRELRLGNYQTSNEHSHSHYWWLEEVGNKGGGPLLGEAILLVVWQEETTLQVTLLLQIEVEHAALQKHQTKHVAHEQAIVEETLQRWPEVRVVHVGGVLTPKSTHICLLHYALCRLMDDSLGQTLGEESKQDGSHKDRRRQNDPTQPPAHVR